ncbi:RHS repeat-associated core domain-containing protein [Pseudomonas monteilii]|uniref:RHS repeat-associated core domain-containing protein n=1 Tax=Pseudomonas monteilii TaxID=76759 RepID=UPI00380AF49B
MSSYFYKGQRLATKLTAGKTGSVFAGAEFVLGEICEKTQLLLAVDRQNSIIKVRNSRCYSPYGFDKVASRESILGYNGEHRDVMSGYDLLGNGVRAYSSVLMRFCSADVISPFGAGGINAYAYCEGDPINYLDADGRMKVPSRPVMPSPWDYKQPYGVSPKSHAIKRVSKSSQLPATQKNVGELSIMGNRRPSPGVHPEGASRSTRNSNARLLAVPKDIWEQLDKTGIDPGALANHLVDYARTKGLIRSSLIPDELLSDAIRYKIAPGGGSLVGWDKHKALEGLGHNKYNFAHAALTHTINRVVRSYFPEIPASTSKASIASKVRWSRN